MIDDGLAQSRVSVMYNEESMDEGKSLIDNLENNEDAKNDDDEDEPDEGAALIAQMKSLLQDCKVSLDNKDETDQSKIAKMEEFKAKFQAADSIRQSQAHN